MLIRVFVDALKEVNLATYIVVKQLTVGGNHT
jgi:hypothetical protein